VTDQAQLSGLLPEKQVKIDTRVWFGVKLALWRSKIALDIAVKQAAEIVARCRHTDGCEGAASEEEPCLDACPDREIRMSALVVLNAGRQHAPVNASKLAQQPYMPPSREYFSAVVADLAACQAELAVLRGTVVTMPPTDSPQLKEKSK
jgi:hypothetical protein